MFELMLSSGIRVNELTLLDRNDINLEECSMIVHGKGNKQREVYFSIRTQLLLQEYLKTRDDNYPCLFKSMREKSVKEPRLTTTAIERIINKYGEYANVKAYPHKFRRTFATNLLRKGVPIEQVKTLLGHENLETTQIYAITNEKDIEMNHKNLID